MSTIDSNTTMAAPWVNIVSFLSSPRDVASVALTNHEMTTVLDEAGDYVRKMVAENRYGPAVAHSSVGRHYAGDYGAMLRDDDRRGTWLNLPLEEPIADARATTATATATHRHHHRLEVVAVRYQREHRILRIFVRGQNTLMGENGGAGAGADAHTYPSETPKGPAFHLERLDRDDPTVRNLVFVFVFHKLDDVYNYKGVGRSFQEVPAPPPEATKGIDDDDDSASSSDSDSDKAGRHSAAEETNKCRVFEFDFPYCLDRLCNHPIDIVLCLEHNEFHLFAIPPGGSVEDAFGRPTGGSGGSSGGRAIHRDRDSYAPYVGDTNSDSSSAAGLTLEAQKQRALGRHRVREMLRLHGWDVL